MESARELALTAKEADLTRLFGPNKTNIRKSELIVALAYELADALAAGSKVQTP
jgi:hypothetical protein